MLLLGLFEVLSLLVRLSQADSYHYDNGIYNSLSKYAYISKISYCIDLLRDGHNLTEPIILKPKPLGFSQHGFDQNDYAAAQSSEEIELYLAKLFHYPSNDKNHHQKNHNSLSQGKDDDKDHPPTISESAGFFAIDHSGNGTIILSLRGSVNFRDYLTDLNTRTFGYQPLNERAQLNFTGCEGCKVHQGFYKRFGDLEHEIFPTVEKLMQVFPDYKLLVVGHSMGGSIAILAGLEFALMGYDPLIVAYGNPKVSNEPLSDYMDSLFLTDFIERAIQEDHELSSGCIRVVHAGDYVPMFPPGRKKFVQSGLEFLINKDELPHPKASVEYRGKADAITHDSSFKVSDLFSFDLDTMFHFTQHREYFYNIVQCTDIE